MIKLQNCVPKVYYQQSRDFQFIGRLFDIIFNSIKTNTDLIYSLPISDDSDTALIDLLAMSLGFKSKHNYNIKQLTAICKIFPTILKNKGSLQAIELAGRALLNAEGLSDSFRCELVDNDLKIFISDKLTDTNLLRDLLTYILPAGISCDIIRTTLRSTEKVVTEIFPKNNVNITKVNAIASTIPTRDDFNEYDSTGSFKVIEKNNFINQTVIGAAQGIKAVDLAKSKVAKKVSKGEK